LARAVWPAFEEHLTAAENRLHALQLDGGGWIFLRGSSGGGGGGGGFRPNTLRRRWLDRVACVSVGCGGARVVGGNQNDQTKAREP